MDICDISKMPIVGEVYAVPNDITWELEKLTCVIIEENPEISNMLGSRAIHAYFASPIEEENIHTHKNGTKYYSIKTYA